MSNIIPILAATFAATGFWEFISFLLSKNSKRTKLLLGITHTMIIEECEFYIDRGYITNVEYDDLMKYLYDPYKEHGANGLAERLKTEVDKLPNKPPQKAKHIYEEEE